MKLFLVSLLFVLGAVHSLSPTFPNQEINDQEIDDLDTDLLLSGIDLSDLRDAIHEVQADSDDDDDDDDDDDEGSAGNAALATDSDEDEDEDDDDETSSNSALSVSRRRGKKGGKKGRKGGNSRRGGNGGGRGGRGSRGGKSDASQRITNAANDMTNGLLDGNMVGGVSGTMQLMNALGGSGMDSQALNPHAMMLTGMMNGLNPGAPDYTKMRNPQLQQHLNALTQAMNMMMVMSGCYHTFQGLGMMPGVAMAMQPGGLPQAPFSTNAASPTSMIHPALNPLNPNSPMNPFLANHMAIARAGQLFHQLQNAAAQAAMPPQSAMPPIVMQQIPGGPAAGPGTPMHIFSTGGPAYLGANNQQQMNVQHMYHYNTAAQMPNFGAGGLGAINQAGSLGAALQGGF